MKDDLFIAHSGDFTQKVRYESNLWNSSSNIFDRSIFTSIFFLCFGDTLLYIIQTMISDDEQSHLFSFT